MAEITLRGEVGFQINKTQIEGLINGLGEFDDLTINITSNGGCSETGREVYNYLKGLGKNITMKAVDFVYSAGFTIFCAGTTRIAANENVTFLMHSPWLWDLFMGNDSDAQELVRILQEEKQKMIDIYSSTLGIDPEKVEELMNNDDVITAEAAKGFNMVSEILNEPDTYYWAKGKIAAMGYPDKKYLELKQSYKPKTNDKMNEKIEKQIEENTNTLKQFISDVKSLFKGKEPDIKALKLATEEGVELEFDTDDLAVGSKIINDAPDGTYKLTYNEKNWVVVIEGGVVATLSEVAEEEEVSEDLEALKAENEALKLEIEKLKGLQAKAGEFEEQMKQVQAIITPFKQPDGTYKFEAKSMTAEEKDAKKKADIEEFKQKRFGKTEQK
jgi:ATP-dependent protease ClpP protease subunit